MRGWEFGLGGGRSAAARAIARFDAEPAFGDARRFRRARGGERREKEMESERDATHGRTER
jgi:hypothetical protein